MSLEFEPNEDPTWQQTGKAHRACLKIGISLIYGKLTLEKMNIDLENLWMP